MQRKIASVNLLHKKVDYVDIFINWALTIGRLLVILVEIVALGAFIYRFSLDQQLIDLHTKIRQGQTIVSTFKENEARFRNLQDRLDIAANFSTLAEQKTKIFSDIYGFKSPGMNFTTFSIYEGRAIIAANVDSVKSLTDFVDKLKAYPKIETVSLDKIENRPSSASIIVSITASLKTEKDKYAIVAK